MNRNVYIAGGVALTTVGGLLLALRKTDEPLVIPTPPSPQPVTPTIAGLKHRNNPGNIRYIESLGSRWRGQSGVNSGGFGEYDTVANGVRAIYQQFLKYQRDGKDTIAKMIAVYAPNKENPTASYASFVASRLGQLPNVPVNIFNFRVAFTRAIIRFEQGKELFSDNEVDQWTRT